MKAPARIALAMAVGVVLTPLLARAQLFNLTKEQMIAWTSDNPFDRFPDGRPKVPDGLIERARGLSVRRGLRDPAGEGLPQPVPKMASRSSIRTRSWSAVRSPCSSCRCAPTSTP